MSPKRSRDSSGCSRQSAGDRCPITRRSARITGRALAGSLVVLLLAPAVLPAELVVVRYREGSVHGFLALRSSEGKLLASGDLTQVIRPNQSVVSHLVFRFRDGSLDDETAVFSQRGNFQLISDHHIQKGPVFPQATDISVDVATGQVTIRRLDKDREKVEKAHMDIPPDLVNGMILDVLKNLPPGNKETKLSYLAATPKPRLVKLSVTTQGMEPFLVAGIRREAIRYTIKVELGGLAGIIAPLAGKKLPDTHVWIVGGEAPAFVRLSGPLYANGPIWDVEMTSPVWRAAPHPSR